MLGHRRKARSSNPIRTGGSHDEESGGRQTTSRDPSPSHFGVLNLDNYNPHHLHHGPGGLDRLFLSMTHGQRRSFRQVGTILVRWLRKSWWIKLILLGVLVNYGVFYVRYFTMGRPSWLYGSPIPHETVQACLGTIHDSTTSTTSKATGTHVPLQFLKANDPNLYLEWHRFSTNSSSVLGPNHTTRHRLLIAQYSGHGKYAQILDLVAPINAAYAQYWNCDFVLLQGTALTIGSTPSSAATTTTSTTACPSEPRSTFNKIALLELVHQQEYRDRYDMVLILDTDTMIVDFQTDITTLLPSSKSKSPSPSPYLLAAHRVWRWDWSNTWDINAGITLWNIHHESFPTILDQWKQQVLDHPLLVLERNDDQYFLQSVLLQQQQQQQNGILGRLRRRWWNGAGFVYSLTREFQYYQGTVIQHYKRESSTTWSQSSGMEQRLSRIQERIQAMHCGGASTTDKANPGSGAGGATTKGATAAGTTTKIPCPYPLTTKFFQEEKEANHRRLLLEIANDVMETLPESDGSLDSPMGTRVVLAGNP